MASLLDQYEQAASQSRSQRPVQPAMPEPVSSAGFVNARLEDDTPIFNKQRINFTPKDPITHLVVSNNLLVMAMNNNLLMRIHLERPDAPDEVEVPKSVEDKIFNVFLDPTGSHLIISMASGDNFYLSRNSKRPKALHKLKGHQISAVAWTNHNTSDSAAVVILLGTSKGVLFETEVGAGEDGRFFQATRDQDAKQLFNLGRDKHVTITGLAVEKLPSVTLTEIRYFVMATTPGRLYQFIGSVPASSESPVFQNIFKLYIDVPERFLELPGNFGYSQLTFFYPKYRGPPKSFAWMAGPGVYWGNVDVSGRAVQDSVTMDTKLVPYPRDDDERSVAPLAIILTEFHILVLFCDRLRAVCTLNDQLIFDDHFPEKYGKVIRMCQDPLKGTIWVYTTQAVFKYKIVRESRDVWQMYLDRDEFDMARQYCQDNPINLDKVLTKQAEHLYATGKFMTSADIFGLTQNSFEEVTLKFIQLPDKEPLKTFLLKKVARVKPHEKTQLTMLVTWLVEIYLNQLGQLKERGQEMSQAFDATQEEFRKFLAHSRVQSCVGDYKHLVYDLIASHGNIEDMIFFAVLSQDYERVISHYLQNESYKNALDKLAEQSDVELFYKFSPALMQNIPSATVDVWISKKGTLDPKRLIPALVQYDPHKYRAQGNDAIRYLEYCIQVSGVKDEAIHNYLLSLYARLQPEKLMTYLNFQGQHSDHVCYDLKYALRLCAEHEHKRACVHIYTTMGLYEEAVDLALQVDVDLAKQSADRPEDEEELRKKLWLKIARHVVEQEKDIKRAMEFLQECDLLKIEDILPFFPDFVTIDHFKDAICTSLEEYNQHIEELKEEMREATESAQDIRSEINSFRNKYSFVKAQDKCSSCGFPLLTRAFYVFPCMHRFHSDCLVAEVLPNLSFAKRNRVEDLQRKVSSREAHTSDLQGASPASKQDYQNKEELDELVAAECIFCGDMMIRCVDKPFIDEDEYASVMASWM